MTGGGDGRRAPALSARDLQGRALHGALWTVAHTMIALPLAFGVNIVLARVLGVVDYGRLALLTTVLELASLAAGAGVSAALVQFGAKAHAAGRTEDVRVLLMRTQGFRLLVIAPVITAVVLLVADVPAWLMLSAVVFGVWLPAVTGGASVSMSIENRTATGAKIAMVLNLVAQATVLVTVLSTSDPDMVWNARLIVAGLAPFASLLLISKVYRHAVLRPQLPRGLPPGFWRFALPVGLAGIVSSVALSRSEVLLLERFSDPVEVGLYAMAFGLAVHLIAPAQAVINPLLPAVTGLRETSPERVGTAFLRVSRVTATVAAGIGAVLAPAFALLVPVLYGSDFAAAAALVLVLASVTSLIYVQSTMIPFVSARLQGASILRIDLASLVVGVAVGIPMIMMLGAWGAVVGKVCIVAARHLILLTTESESFGVTRRAAMRASSPAILGIAAGCLCYFTGTTWLDGLALLLVPIGGSVLLLLCLRLCRVGLAQDDVDALGSAFRSDRASSWARRLLRSTAYADAGRPSSRV